jgi:uncharacterized membrane protein YhdT
MNARSECAPSEARHALGLALVLVPWIVLGFLMSH